MVLTTQEKQSLCSKRNKNSSACQLESGFETKCKTTQNARL